MTISFRILIQRHGCGQRWAGGSADRASAKCTQTPCQFRASEIKHRSRRTIIVALTVATILAAMLVHVRG